MKQHHANQGSSGTHGLRKALAIISLAILFFVSGCSTLAGDGTAQSINVETIEVASGRRLINVRCDLSNDEGSWTVLTPGTVMVHRSNKPMSVNCQKSGYLQDFTPKANVDSKTKVEMWGNLIIGGPGGAFIDHNNGSAYKYPPAIKIPMRPLAKQALMENMVDQRQSIQATGYAVISVQHHDNPAQQRLLSIRASKLDAYRSLMEQVYGQYLDVNTTVAEMVVESDSFRARVQGVIYGAQLVSITPVGDDTYETTLSLRHGIVDDLRVLYQQLNSGMGG